MCTGAHTCAYVWGAAEVTSVSPSVCLLGGAGDSDSILDVFTESKPFFFSFSNIGQFLEIKVGLRFTR